MLSQIGSMLLFCCLPMLPVGDEGGVPLAGNKPGQQSLELRRFDVLSLTARYTTPEPPVFGRVFGDRAWEKGRGGGRGGERAYVWPLDGVHHGESARFLLPLSGKEEAQPPISMEDLVEFVRMSRSGADWDREGSSIAAFMDRVLQVTEQKVVLDQVQAALENLRLTLAPRYEFHCLIYELKPGEQDQAGGAMDPAAATALEQRVLAGAVGRSVHAARGVGRPGDTLRFSKWRRVALQLDGDVEIAQEATITQPVVEPLLLGHDLIVNPVLAPDGRDVALFCLFTARSQEGEFVPYDVGAVGLDTIEQATVAQVQSAFSVRLPATGALLLRAGGASRPGLRLLLQCKRIDPWPQEPAGHAMLPIGLLTAPALTCEEDGLARISTHAEQPDLIIETIQQAIGGEIECRTYADGAFLCFAAPPEKVAAARGLVQYLAAARTPSYRLDAVREARPVGSPDAPWQAYGVPVEMLCLSGRLGFAQAGRERLFVGGFDVEVAQKSKIADPLVFACFDGLQAVVSADAAGERVHVRLALLDRSVLGFRTVPSVSPDLGAVQVPEIEEVVVQQNLLMKPGETVSLGDGPTRMIPGRGACQTRLSIRLTRL